MDPNLLALDCGVDSILRSLTAAQLLEKHAGDPLLQHVATASLNSTSLGTLGVQALSYEDLHLSTEGLAENLANKVKEWTTGAFSKVTAFIKNSINWLKAPIDWIFERFDKTKTPDQKKKFPVAQAMALVATIALIGTGIGAATGVISLPFLSRLKNMGQVADRLKVVNGGVTPMGVMKTTTTDKTIVLDMVKGTDGVYVPKPTAMSSATWATIMSKLKAGASSVSSALGRFGAAFVNTLKGLAGLITKGADKVVGAGTSVMTKLKPGENAGFVKKTAYGMLLFTVIKSVVGYLHKLIAGALKGCINAMRKFTASVTGEAYESVQDEEKRKADEKAKEQERLQKQAISQASKEG